MKRYKIFLLITVTLLLLGGISYLWITKGGCYLEYQQKVGSCIAGRLYVETKNGVSRDQVFQIISKYPVSFLFEENPKITIWDIDLLDNYSQDISPFQKKWNFKLKDEIVSKIDYYPVQKENASLKAVIYFKSSTSLEQVKKYLNEKSISQDSFSQSEIESTWYNQVFYLKVPFGDEKKYENIFKNEDIFQTVKLEIFQYPSNGVPNMPSITF